MNPAIMPVLNLLVNFLQERRILKTRVLPLVESVSQLADPAERRMLVLQTLMTQGLDETTARLLVEKGVRLWKKREAKRLKKAAKMAARGN